MSTIKQLIQKLISQKQPATEPFIVTEHSVKLGRVFPLMGLALALLLSLMYFFTPCVNVYWNGSFIGTAESAASAENVAETVAQHVSEVTGKQVSYSETVTTSVTVAFRKDVLDRSQLRAAMLSNIDEITNRYVLTIDGVEAGSAASLAPLQAVMNNLVLKNSAEAGTEADIVSTCSLAYKTIPADMTTSIGDITTRAEELTVMQITTTETATAAIPYETDIILDDTMYAGNWEIVTEGVDGQRSITREITRQDETIVNTLVVGSEITVQPVTQVIRMGTVPRPITASYGEYYWPAEGIISSYYGPRWGSFHYGIDICSALETPITAADGGTVTFAGVMSGYGNLVIITHDNGDTTYYGHLNSICVAEGEAVFRGQTIGGMGSTGRSTGVHLHFEVRVDDYPLDPITFLP